MGGVSNADQLPGGASTRTVEEITMAIRSYSLFTDIPRLEVHRQLIWTSRSLPVLAPTSTLQIQTGRGILLASSDQLPVGVSSLPTVVIHPPKESSWLTTTRTGKETETQITSSHVGACGCMCTVCRMSYCTRQYYSIQIGQRLNMAFPPFSLHDILTVSSIFRQISTLE